MSIEIKQQEKQSNGVGYQSAIGVAVVTAVFSIFIILLLGLNVYHTKVTDPVRMAELEK